MPPCSGRSFSSLCLRLARCISSGWTIGVGDAASCSSSILVNLETHKIVDLLADREAESVRRWLAAHPEVDVVSRDRGGCYIDGATLGAPQATQVADRWHILSNLGDAVEEFLIRAHIRLEDSPANAPTPEHPLTTYSA